MKYHIILFFFLTQFWSWCHGYEYFDFSINKTSKAIVSITGSMIEVKVAADGASSSRNFEIDSESKLKFKKDDFNFDGNLDFEVWYFDEGMGVYTIHRLFIFDPLKKVFNETHPKCGDQFLNLEVNRKKRVLYSTFFVDNMPKRCVTHFKLR